MDATQRGTDATIIRLNVALLDELSARMGATTNPQRAELFETDRATIVRWRHHRSLPALGQAFRMARKLGTSVDKLVVEVAA